MCLRASRISPVELSASRQSHNYTDTTKLRNPPPLDSRTPPQPPSVPPIPPLDYLSHSSEPSFKTGLISSSFRPIHKRSSPLTSLAKSTDGIGVEGADSFETCKHAGRGRQANVSRGMCFYGGASRQVRDEHGGPGTFSQSEWKQETQKSLRLLCVSFECDSLSAEVLERKEGAR
jgi:hypothetical protein